MWEYLKLVVADGEPKYSLFGKVKMVYPGLEEMEVMNELGELDWELVFSDRSPAARVEHYFKRKKAGIELA